MKELVRQFLVGLVIGSVIGVVIMSLLALLN